MWAALRGAIRVYFRQRRRERVEGKEQVMQATAGRPTTASTKDVLDHHLKCFGEGNLEGILADYSSDAVLFMPTGPLKGPDAMKPVFQTIFSEFAKPGASFVMRQQCVEGDYAYILWNAETADNYY